MKTVVLTDQAKAEPGAWFIRADLRLSNENSRSTDRLSAGLDTIDVLVLGARFQRSRRTETAYGQEANSAPSYLDSGTPGHPVAVSEEGAMPLGLRVSSSTARRLHDQPGGACPMRWARYRSADGSTRRGVVHDSSVHALGTGLLELLRAEGGLEVAATGELTETVELATAGLLAPMPVPPAVRDFAAFERHVSNEGKAAVGDGTVGPVWYAHPLFPAPEPSWHTG